MIYLLQILQMQLIVCCFAFVLCMLDVAPRNELALSCLIVPHKFTAKLPDFFRILFKLKLERSVGGSKH